MCCQGAEEGAEADEGVDNYCANTFVRKNLMSINKSLRTNDNHLSGTHVEWKQRKKERLIDSECKEQAACRSGDRMRGTRKSAAGKRVSGRHWRVVWGDVKPSKLVVGMQLCFRVAAGNRLVCLYDVL